MEEIDLIELSKEFWSRKKFLLSVIILSFVVCWVFSLLNAKVVNEFIANNNSSEKQFLVKIKNKANKLNPEKHTNIENIQKEILIESLNKEYLINNLQKERRIVVILDNYSVHKANLVIQASEILNIKLIQIVKTFYGIVLYPFYLYIHFQLAYQHLMTYFLKHHLSF